MSGPFLLETPRNGIRRERDDGRPERQKQQPHGRGAHCPDAHNNIISMPIRYKAQLNQGNANIGSEKSVSANEDLLTCDERALAREISHQSHGLITEDVAALVLSHFAKASAEKMSEGFRIQFNVDGKVAMIIFPDIHVKGGNINLARAQQLDPTVTELTVQNAAQLIDKAGGVTCRVRCTAMQPFTDLLEKVEYSLERTGTVEAAYVEASDGSEADDSGSGDETPQGGGGDNGDNE